MKKFKTSNKEGSSLDLQKEQIEMLKKLAEEAKNLMLVEREERARDKSHFEAVLNKLKSDSLEIIRRIVLRAM